MIVHGPLSREVNTSCARHPVYFPAVTPVLALLFCLASATPSVAGTVRWVPSEYPTINAAVTASGSGDSIMIDPGTYTGAGNRGIAPGGRTIHFQGGGPLGSVVIDAEGLDNGFTLADFAGAPSSITNITIRNGDPYGIYVYNNSPTISECGIESCNTGILFADCDGLLFDCTIEGCRSGGISITTGSLCTIRFVQIRNNDGQYGAGLMVISANPTIENCTVSGNDAAYDGGGIYAENSGVVMHRMIITGNRAAGLGGGIRLLTGSAVFDTSTVARNSSGVIGGGVYGTNSSASFDHSILWGNCAPGGHEIFADASSNVHFGCSAVDLDGLIGGGIYSYTESIHSDPLFCDMGSCADVPTTAGNFHLALDSPCSVGVCGGVGALGYACSATPVRETTWGWIRASFR